MKALQCGVRDASLAQGINAARNFTTAAKNAYAESCGFQGVFCNAKIGEGIMRQGIDSGPAVWKELFESLVEITAIIAGGT